MNICPICAVFCNTREVMEGTVIKLKSVEVTAVSKPAFTDFSLPCEGLRPYSRFFSRFTCIILQKKRGGVLMKSRFTQVSERFSDEHPKPKLPCNRRMWQSTTKTNVNSFRNSIGNRARSLSISQTGSVRNH